MGYLSTDKKKITTKTFAEMKKEKQTVIKKLAFFILLSLVTLGVSAQSNLKWNVNAGIGMSNWYGDDTDGTDAKFAYKVGIGLEVPFANTNIWSFQTGLNFISKGVKGDGVTDAWLLHGKIP